MSVLECEWDFYVHIFVHHKSLYLGDQRDAVLSSLYLFNCQVTLHVSGVSCTHHQEYTNCSCNNWYKSWIWRCNNKIRLKRVHGWAATSLSHGQILTCTSGCNYSLCTPDDGRGRHPKHVEWLGSKTNKDCWELHLVGLLSICELDLARCNKFVIPKSSFLKPALFSVTVSRPENRSNVSVIEGVLEAKNNFVRYPCGWCRPSVTRETSRSGSKFIGVLQRHD